MKTFYFTLFLIFGVISSSYASTPSTVPFDQFQSIDLAAEAMPDGHTDLVSLQQANELQEIDVTLEENSDVINRQADEMSEASLTKEAVSPSKMEMQTSDRGVLVTKKVTVADMANFESAKGVETWLQDKATAMKTEKPTESPVEEEYEPDASMESEMDVSRLIDIKNKVRNLIHRLTNRNVEEAQKWLQQQENWIENERVENTESVVEMEPEESEAVEIPTSARQLDNTEEEKRSIISWIDDVDVEGNEQEPEPSTEVNIPVMARSSLKTSSKQINGMDEIEEEKRGIIAWLDGERVNEDEDELEPSAEPLEISAATRLQLLKESLNKYKKTQQLLNERSVRPIKENVEEEELRMSAEPEISFVARDGVYDHVTQWLDQQNEESTSSEEEPEMSAEPMMKTTTRDGVYDQVTQWLDQQNEESTSSEEEPEMSAEPMMKTTTRDGVYDQVTQWLDQQNEENTSSEEEPEMSTEPMMKTTTRDGVYDQVTQWLDQQNEESTSSEEEPEMSAEPMMPVSAREIGHDNYPTTGKAAEEEEPVESFELVM